VTDLPSVSVAIPCHNYGRYLDEACASVFAQDLAFLDMSIVDDGSTDDSWTRAEAIRDRDARVRLVRHDEPVGAPGCFNAAVRATEGNLVVILSADDRLAPNYLRTLATAIVSHGWDFAYPDVLLFGAEDRLVPAIPFDPARLFFNNFITGSTMFRREAFDGVGGFDASLGDLGHEDWDFWLRVVRRGFDGGPVSGAPLQWRRHEIGSRNTRSLRRYWRVRLAMWRRHWRVVPFGTKVSYLAGSNRRTVNRGQLSP
jgi:GT2 family glycosyltransferase